MNNELFDYEYLVDFDGVILDSQDRFQNDMKDNNNIYDWIEYLSSIEWYKFLRECNEIDESIYVLKELQKYKKLLGIITAIHSFNEGQEKLVYLREKEIKVPVFYTLPYQKKCDVYIPNKRICLVDDKQKNCIDWQNAGGSALVFDKNMEHEEKGKIRTLKKLL